MKNRSKAIDHVAIVIIEIEDIAHDIGQRIVGKLVEMLDDRDKFS
jgi:hypothetical protein